MARSTVYIGVTLGRFVTIGACPCFGALLAVIEREGDGYVAICPEFDIASQGNTVEEAQSNLTEALTLFFETAAPSEIDRRRG
jgi:predicted RNase H-like HicB family nuclease